MSQTEQLYETSVPNFIIFRICMRKAFPFEFELYLGLAWQGCFIKVYSGQEMNTSHEISKIDDDVLLKRARTQSWARMEAHTRAKARVLQRKSSAQCSHAT